jgi:hypothetical protein
LKKTYKKKKTVIVVEWPCKKRGMAVLWFSREREEREGKKR